MGPADLMEWKSASGCQKFLWPKDGIRVRDFEILQEYLQVNGYANAVTYHFNVKKMTVTCHKCKGYLKLIKMQNRIGYMVSQHPYRECTCSVNLLTDSEISQKEFHGNNNMEAIAQWRAHEIRRFAADNPSLVIRSVGTSYQLENKIQRGNGTSSYLVVSCLKPPDCVKQLSYVAKGRSTKRQPPTMRVHSLQMLSTSVTCAICHSKRANILFRLKCNSCDDGQGCLLCSACLKNVTSSRSSRSNLSGVNTACVVDISEAVLCPCCEKR